MDQITQQAREPNAVVTWISNALIAISAAALGVMLFLSVADVIGRYFFLRPIEGTSELVGTLLIIASSLGLGYCQLVKGNISIDVFTRRFKPRGQAILNICSYLMSIAVTVIMTWRGSLMMYDYMFKQLGGTSATLGIILWPFMFIMSLGFAWVTIIFLIDLFNSFVEVFRR